MPSKQKKKKKGFWYELTHAKSLTNEQYRAMVRKIAIVIGASFLLSFIVFFGIALFGGLNQVVGVILQSNLSWYALAFLAVFIGYLLSFVKWNYFLHTLKLKVPFRKNFAVYMSLYSMELTPGRIGRVLTAYTLNRITNIRFINIVPIVTMDIFTDFLGMAILALIAAVYFGQYLILVIIVDFVLLLPFLFLLNDWFFRLLKRIMKASKWFSEFSVYGEEYFTSQSKLNKPKIYAVALLFTIPSSVFYALSLFFSLVAIGVFPHIGGSVLIYSISQVTGMVTSIPGNIGVTDGVLVASISSVFGLSSAAASAVTIMTRIASLWFGVILGGIFLFYTFRYWVPKKK